MHVAQAEEMPASCLRLWETNFSWREKKQSMGAVLLVRTRSQLSPVDAIFIWRASTTAISNSFFSSFDAFPVTYSRNAQYLTKFSHLRNRKKILYSSILKPVLNNLRIAFFVHINN